MLGTVKRTKYVQVGVAENWEEWVVNFITKPESSVCVYHIFICVYISFIPTSKVLNSLIKEWFILESFNFFFFETIYVVLTEVELTL